MSANLFYLKQCQLKHCKPHYFVFSLLAVFFLVPSYAQKRNISPTKSSFTASLMSLETTAKKPFRYNTSLHNGSGKQETYDLVSLVPDGWATTFQAQGSEVSSINIDSGKTEQISIKIDASPEVKPGKYSIPVIAVSPGDTLRLALEAVVKGNYEVELSTPTGLLSDDVTEGSSKVIQLTVVNTGSLPLDGLELAAETPVKWTATFDPAKVARLEPGKTQDIKATLAVPDKTIAGDYATKFTVKNNYVNADATFRMTVTTSFLSGWIGILIILLALGIVYYLIRKYGRR